MKDQNAHPFFIMRLMSRICLANMRAGESRCLSTKADHSLYDILGVTPLASMAEIKKAYRYRAMRCHPDTDQHGTKGREAEFIAVSSAYEVLSDSSKRRQYDEALRREPTASGQQDGPAQQPAAGSREASVHDNSRYTSDWASSSWRRRGQKIRAATEPPASGDIPTQALDPQEVAKWRYNAGSWMMKVPQPDTTPSTSPLGRYLDRYQREFEGDLRSALRLAYLGPSLHHLAPNQLPKHLEAEERTDPLSNNILNLVSGRTLLGSISLSPEAESSEILPDLYSSSTKSQDLSEYEPNTSYSHPRTLFGPAIESAFDPLRFLDPPDRREAEIASGNIVVKLLEEHRGGPVDPSKEVLGGLRLRRRRFPEIKSESVEEEMPQSYQGKGCEEAANEESATLLEEFEEEMQEVSSPLETMDEGPSKQSDDLSSPSIFPPPSSRSDTLPSEGGDVLFMRLRGKLWAKATRQKQNPSAPSRITIRFPHKQPPHDLVVVMDDGIYDSNGKRTGHLIQIGLIAVSTIHIFDTSNRKIKLLCRLTRSQPIPSSLWMFPPRVQTHSGASWYVEWGGYVREGKEGWLDPGVHLFVAAFATLDFERGIGKTVRVASKSLAIEKYT